MIQFKISLEPSPASYFSR